MTGTTRRTVQRRNFLKALTAGAVVTPFGLSLASCAAGGSGPSEGGGGGGATGAVTDTNPFGVAADSTVEAIIFDGGYGTDYASFAANLLQENQDGVTVDVTGSTQIAQQMQPRFVGGNPPDLLDNSGANAIGISTIAAQLEDLQEVIDAVNTEGTPIADTLYPNVLGVGQFDGRLVAINYVLTVYALWYSQTLFDANGWTAPQTWDDALALGAAAQEQGKYLFTWGREAASYFLTMALDSAIKEGGDEVRLQMANLQADAWSGEAITGVLAAMEQVVANGYMRPGGAGTQFTQAQAQWSQAQEALLYPSGSWIENEMADATADDFQMTGAPAPTVTADAALPYAAINNTPNEPFAVPSQGANAAGGKEMLRVMLSPETATEFARTKLASTIVAGTIPEDAFGSTALAAQVSMLEAAGTDTFNYNFVATYGMTADVNVLWNSFLSGDSDAAALAEGMQALFDRIREDDSVEKVEVS
ncbi:N-acetylglucosamine/diacetylchitobiose ABC transporter substrate-binding protein [Pseudokineococcus lusitanus]|uniref:Carbohydrate ABC transporter substrate-binding protein (CUT1 family) n=1 Tax=Pseudokineococcus lusitanus TaxID=763993 RepID=A0A3N1GWB8_9ACTN|nr:N-acetylglucosamine/diacetylchitobiose ABC transporter substrate-binding protein [Pseudokineococcus lusitanus]ROP34527.1 carbohydrate ABC transporter substrate-binding protein (CUT1 family) [Pseudokineococcus lusitanus]